MSWKLYLNGTLVAEGNDYYGFLLKGTGIVHYTYGEPHKVIESVLSNYREDYREKQAAIRIMAQNYLRARVAKQREDANKAVAEWTNEQRAALKTTED